MKLFTSRFCIYILAMKLFLFCKGATKLLIVHVDILQWSMKRNILSKELFNQFWSATSKCSANLIMLVWICCKNKNISLTCVSLQLIMFQAIATFLAMRSLLIFFFGLLQYIHQNSDRTKGIENGPFFHILY